MNKLPFLIAILALPAATLPVRAQDNEPEKASSEQTAKPAAKAEAPKAEPKAEAPKAEPKAEAPAKKEKEAPKKELSAAGKALTPLAESYKKAYEELQRWIDDIERQTAEITTRINKAQEDIQKNEAAITKAKLDGDDKAGRELAKENKQLWADLAAAKKERSGLYAGFAREAASKVKSFGTDAAEKLQQAKAGLK